MLQGTESPLPIVVLWHQNLCNVNVQSMPGVLNGGTEGQWNCSAKESVIQSGKVEVGDIGKTISLGQEQWGRQIVVKD